MQHMPSRASKLVRVRFPAATYKKLQSHKRALGLDSDAEAVRAIVADYEPWVKPSEMPVFSAPISKASRRPRADALRRIDDIVYGPRPGRRSRRRS